MDIDEIKRELKNKRRNKLVVKPKHNYLSKFLILVIITLITLIALKGNTKLKTDFYKNVFEKNFKFSSINKMFKDKFGVPIPFSDVIEKKETKQVFSEKLKYSSKSKYLDGVKLKVENNYLVPNIENGIVVFVGKKDNYGDTVIVEGTDGVDIWYCNVKSSLKLYDYIEKESLIGEALSNEIYLVYKKDGKVLNYEDYI